jgi:recombination protein RecT
VTTNARNAVARRAENVGAVQQNGQQPPNLSQQIERMRPEIARALPKHMDAVRIARIALTTLRRTPKLGQCSPESFLGALMTCSQLGVEPGGPTGEA